MDPADQYLAHYGIPGMKWGKHKRRPVAVSPSKARSRQNGSNPRAAKLTPFSKDAKNAQTFQRVARTQGTQALSNAQLQALVNRQNLERQYASLNPPAVSAGQKIMKQLLPVAGKIAQDQWNAHQPQRPAAVPTKELEVYSKPTMGQMVGRVAMATGKQVLAEKGLDIGLTIVKSLLK